MSKNDHILQIKRNLVYTKEKTVSYEIKHGLWEKLEKMFILKDKEKNMNKLILKIFFIILYNIIYIYRFKSNSNIFLKIKLIKIQIKIVYYKKILLI